MTETKTVEAVLAKLQAPTRTKSEKWARVESNLEYIIAAKKRRASWQSIADALAEAGIESHPETLRLYVTKHPQYLDAFPPSSSDTSTQPRKRRKVKRGAKSKRPEKQNEGTHKSATEGWTEKQTETTHRAPTAPASGPSLETAPKSKFLKMEPTL